MTNTTIPDQLQNLWRTRPVRLPDNGPGAGVCAGIGHRYSIDPVLVRVAFVVSTVFGGSGLVLYLAAWLTFARAGDPVSAAESLVGRGRSSESHTTMVVLAVALVIALVTVGPIGVGLGGSGAVSLLAMLGGWWLLYQRTPEPPFGSDSMFAVPTSTPGVDVPMWNAYSTLPTEYVPAERHSTPSENAPSENAQTAGPIDLTKPGSTPPTDRPAEAPLAGPPQWDPLGVAPFAWDLPDPAPSPIVPAVIPKTRSRLTKSVIGLAIIATAIAAAVAAGTGNDWFTVSRVAAVGLAVVGIGMIVGAFLRKGYGLLILAAPLTGFVILTAAVDPSDIDSSQVGARTYAPTTMAQLQPAYTASIGEVILDLRELTLTEDRDVSIDTGVGNVEVYLPADMDVVNNCSGNVGNVECLGNGAVDGGADGVGGPVLTLDIDNSVGNVEVHRG